MAMLPPVYQLLKASPAVTAIIGSNPMKCYRHGIAPQGTVAPYVAWMVISDDAENNISGLPATDRWTMQLDCYDPTDGGIERLAEAVRNAIEPTAHLTGFPVDQRELDTGLYRISLQFDYWLSR